MSGRRWLRRVVRGVLAVVALVVVVAGAAVIAVHTAWGRDVVRRELVAQLAAVFPGGLSIGRLEGSPFGELVARDVALRGVDGQPMLQIATLRATLALRPLARGTARVESLVAEGVVVERPRAPLVIDPLDTSPPSAWRVELPRVVLRDVRVVAPGFELVGGEVEAAAAIAAHGGPIAAHVAVRGTWRERGLPVAVHATAWIADGVTLPYVVAEAGAARLFGVGLRVDPAAPRGALVAATGAAEVARLAPGVALPGGQGVAVAVFAGAPIAHETPVAVIGALGADPVRGWLRVDLRELARVAVRGAIEAEVAALRTLAPAAPPGGARVVVALAATPQRVAGVALARGALAGMPAAHATMSFAATRDGAALAGDAIAVAAGDGGALIVARGGVRGTLLGDFALTAPYAFATARDLAATTGGLAAVRGVLRAEVSGAATSALAPIDVAVRGTLSADRLRYDTLAVARVGGQFRGRVTAAGFAGGAAVTARGVWDEGEPLLTDATLTAQLAAGGALRGHVVARPAAVPGVVVEADGATRLGMPLRIALADHSVTLPTGGRTRGRGGEVVITATETRLRGVRTWLAGGAVDVEVAVARPSRSLTATIDARDLPLSALDPTLAGSASARVRLARRGLLHWDGGMDVDVRGAVLAAGQPAVDASAAVAISGRRVVVDGSASSAGVGSASFALDVVGPVDLTDGVAWQRLERSAVTSLTLGLRDIDLGGLLARFGVATGGRIDGAIHIAGADTQGTLRVTGVRTPIGEVAGDVQFAPMDHSELGASSTAHVAGIGDATLAARIAFPARPFDPAAWRALGLGALSTVSVSIEDIALEPAQLAALGVPVDVRGRGSVSLALVGATSEARIAVELAGVTGGPLRRPLDVELQATTDRGGTNAEARVFASNAPATAPTAAARTLLLEARGGAPVTFDRWLADARRALDAPILGGRVTIPALDAALLLALFGRADVERGSVQGDVAVAGTLRVPTAQARLALRDIAVRERIAGRPVPLLEELSVTGSWGGAAGSVTITGRERRAKGPPGTLRITAQGTPAKPATLATRLDITAFDIAPIAAFLPGAAGAAQGVLDARLALVGLDPTTSGGLRGTLKLTGGRFPVPRIGTLREGKLDATIDDRGVRLGLTGKLRAGDIALTATSPGHALTAVDATLAIRRVAPIGELEPVIDAKVTAALTRSGRVWSGKVRVRDGSIVLPASTGVELIDPDAPVDVFFTDQPGPVPSSKLRLGAPPPERPWLIAQIDLGETRIEAADLFDTRGLVEGKLELQVGETLGMDGRIEIVRATVGDLFGRAYTAEGHVDFDGTTDPELALTLIHAFPAMTLSVFLSGPLSNPHAPEFASSEKLYSRDQLFGFFLGGDPGGDPASQSREAAAGATASVLSGAIGGRVKKVLPVKIDVLRCDPGSSAAGASCTVGKWLGDKFFVAVKSRLEPRPTENSNDAQFQYYLRQSFLLEGVVGDRSYHGADLLWRHRW